MRFKLARRFSRVVLKTVSLTLIFALCACSGLSDYEKGLQAFINQDYGTAFRLMHREAELGNPDAAYYLGTLYSRGLGVDESQPESERWYRRAFDSYLVAANAGDARAQTRLCFMHFAGRGTSQNYSEAYRWCEKAAQLGNPTAQRNLSVMYEHGYGVPQDPVKAQYWRSKAQERGE
jgi:TPR repeat protein